jgi:hypothetical protein
MAPLIMMGVALILGRFDPAPRRIAPRTRSPRTSRCRRWRPWRSSRHTTSHVGELDVNEHITPLKSDVCFRLMCLIASNYAVNRDDRNACGQERSGGSTVECLISSPIARRDRILFLAEHRSLCDSALIFSANPGKLLTQCSHCSNRRTISQLSPTAASNGFTAIDLKPVHAAVNCAICSVGLFFGTKVSDCSRHNRVR